MSVSLIETIGKQPNDNHFNPSSVFSNDRNKISDVSITINNEYGYFMTSFLNYFKSRFQVLIVQN